MFVFSCTIFHVSLALAKFLTSWREQNVWQIHSVLIMSWAFWCSTSSSKTKLEVPGILRCDLWIFLLIQTYTEDWKICRAQIVGDIYWTGVYSGVFKCCFSWIYSWNFRTDQYTWYTNMNSIKGGEGNSLCKKLHHFPEVWAFVLIVV